jgi:Na+-transporting methylmalonyl-CoA/oxaloacetate decarboxylase gamma subunit
MEEQDTRIKKQNEGETPEQPRTAETQVGNVIDTLSRATRQLTKPVPNQPKRPAAQTANAALRERIAQLIIALGDPQDPAHHQAADDLIAIGAPAVPALNEALSPTRPWLTAYRSAEILGQIGDGRAAGPLLEALRHPNSNVRWGAVRALAVVGDARALLELRRVAREDQSKTSWGESVGGTAQSVLDQMQSHNLILRGVDLLKTAVACVAMLVTLILAWSLVGQVRAEWQRVGQDAMPASIAAPLASADDDEDEEEAASIATPTPEPTPDAAETQDTGVITGTALFTGNVRALPTTSGDQIGSINEGDEVEFVAISPRQDWYLIRLGETYSSRSFIDGVGGLGWVSRSLLSEPNGNLPVEDSTDPIETTSTPSQSE